MNKRSQAWWLAVGLAACGGSGGSDDDATPEERDAGMADAGNEPGADASTPADLWPNVTCDPLVPTYCRFPFPSNVWTVADPSTPTGRRLALRKEAMIVSKDGVVTDHEPFNASDGFSPGAALLAHLPGATMEGLPDAFHPETSLAKDAPVVLISEDGDRVPIWIEIDHTGPDDDERSFMIRPAVRLADATRYIVAIRGVRDAEGPIAPSPAFAALRDGTAYDGDGADTIEARRTLYEDLFTRLERAGVKKNDLQLAWDFTTASRENNTRNVLFMRDEVLAKYETTSPKWTITKVTPDPDPRIAFEIEGTVDVPLYLTSLNTDGRMIFGDDGLPAVNEERPTADVYFIMNIPKSATKDKPAALVQYGHGLLGDPGEIKADHLIDLANEHNYVVFGIHQWGLTTDGPHLAIDRVAIGLGLGMGALDAITPMFDRLQQSQLNHLVVMRAMINGLGKDSDYAALIDESKRYYMGASQGGIFGGTYMALSTDVTRGVLDVMGQPYHLLLPRSVDFDDFFNIMRGQWPDERDQMLGLALVQMLWDRSEPNGYSPYIRDHLLPGTPAHEVLMRAAVGDHQVTYFGGRVMARSVGAKHLDTGVGEVFGLETVDAITEGSAYLEVDFGLPADPICGIPQRACEDPHGLGRKIEGAIAQADAFFRTGRVENVCGGDCIFPELSGCTPEDTTPACE